ncbi:MBL fold metallo-hydrolase, partial [Candidatus Peregrinibacteria bacterium]|nr:MBL fold metallo-hydrolase [Candidatus Peregrinibacteria bacterium]
ASGMCEHGRILHHLRNNVENSRNTVLIVGYQAENTLGRRIVEQRKVVKIFGKPYRLKAEVCIVDAFSAHADRNDLLEFSGAIQGLKKVFIVHGESKQTESLAEAIRAQGIKDVRVPMAGEEIEV